MLNSLAPTTLAFVFLFSFQATAGTSVFRCVPGMDFDLAATFTNHDFIDSVKSEYKGEKNTGERLALDQLSERLQKSNDAVEKLAIQSYLQYLTKGSGFATWPNDFLQALDLGRKEYLAQVYGEALKILEADPAMHRAAAAELAREKILAKKDVTKEPLDLNKRSDRAKAFVDSLKSKVLSQDDAIEALGKVYDSFLTGLHPKGRPIGNLLFLGPTGSGKTRLVEAMAEFLSNDSNAMIKVDCAELQHDHEIAKLIGAPPGWVGHKDTMPKITQEAIDNLQTKESKLTILLFDEIEKGSDALFQLMLGMMDKGVLTLGNNDKVDLSNVLIIMTSNLGAQEMAASSAKHGIGFTPSKQSTQSSEDDYAKMTKIAVGAAERNFSPEFMNRVDKTVVFRNLDLKDMPAILDNMLTDIYERFMSSPVAVPFVFDLTDGMKTKLLIEGYDKVYGARQMKRAVENNIIFPISQLLGSGQIKLGDHLEIDFNFTTDQIIVNRLNDKSIIIATHYKKTAPAKEKVKNRVVLTDNN